MVWMDFIIVDAASLMGLNQPKFDFSHEPNRDLAK
jgi:hypothetical protein